MNNRGQLIVYLILVVLLLFAGGIWWLFFHDQELFGGLKISLPFMQSKTQMDTSNWKAFPVDQRLTVLYPPNWYVTEERYISQYPYTPGRTTNDVYNVITVAPITSQIQTSY